MQDYSTEDILSLNIKGQSEAATGKLSFAV